MADNYFRLVCFVVNICPELLREFFIQLAKKDAGPSYASLDAYLTRRKVDILKIKKFIRNDQFDMLFPSNGTANESQWDVTLLVTLITNLFPTHVQPLEELAMKEIREIRNTLQHISNTANVSNSDFISYWGRLDSAAMSLAHTVFSTADQIALKTKIDEMKKNRLPNVLECLRLWHEETVKQTTYKIEELSNTVTDLKKKLDDVESNTSKTASILQQVTVQKPGPNGDASFDSTIKELPDNFNAPAEVADIRTTLRDKHYVVVTGSYNSRYFETALAAVNGMNYNYRRCVEMQKSSDWRHLDPDDVDFVFCRDPFGSIAYDENKARSMDDIFKSMMHTAQEDQRKRIDIMIVTDSTILTECKQFYDHDILGQVVKVFHATTAEQPADLTSVCDRVHNVYSSSSQMTNNLRVLTDNFLRQYSITSGQVDASTLRAARDKFKANKAIVLSGPKSSGKTSAAVALSSSYQPSQCLLLTEPNDVKSISFHNTCLVIIDEFAGKYRYEKNKVYEWYSMFDHLYSAVTAGLLNVVVTSEKSKLDRCLAEISPHPLLAHRVDLPGRTVVVKQEPSEVAVLDPPATAFLNNDPHFSAPAQGYNQLPRLLIQTDGAVNEPGNVTSTEIQSVSHFNESMAISANSSPLTGSRLWTVKNETTKCIRVGRDINTCYIRGCCQLPTGDILLADGTNSRLKKFDDSYNVISMCELPSIPHDVCYIGNNEAVVAQLDSTLQYVNVISMTLTRSVSTDHRCFGLTCHFNELYVADIRTIYLYSINGIKQRVLYTCNDLYGVPSIAVSNDGSKIYITCENKLITIDSSGNDLYTFTDPELSYVRDVCVDGEGHVLVCDSLQSILQISSDGKHKLGTIVNKIDSIHNIQAICFDRHKSTLICAGISDNVAVLQLK